MTDVPINPFRPTRWEHHRDGQQLIWYSSVADQLSAEKSFYVSGSRGSGKTTLLRSICWEDLTKNTSLRLQRTFDDAKSIACYVRFPDHLTAALSAIDWKRVYPETPTPELELHRYFSLLLELTCLQRAIDASHELRISGYIAFEPRQELEFPKLLLSEFPKLREFAEGEALTVHTLPDTSRLLRIIVRQMNQAAGRGTIKSINDRLPAREPGELLGFAI